MLPHNAFVTIVCGALFLAGSVAILHTPKEKTSGIEISCADCCTFEQRVSPCDPPLFKRLPKIGTDDKRRSQPVKLAIFEEEVGPRGQGLKSNNTIQLNSGVEPIKQPSSTEEQSSTEQQSSTEHLAIEQRSLQHDLKNDIHQLSMDDRVVLANLPPMCTSELPGLDLSDQPQVVTLATMNSVAETAHYPLHDTTRPKLSDSNSDEQEPNEFQIQRSDFQESSPKSAIYQANIDDAHGGRSANGMHATRPTNRVASLPNPHAAASGVVDLSSPHPTGNPNEPDPHLEIYSRSAFPSAKDCATCHKQIYEEWAVSSHAYAGVSPMFHAFEDTINRLSQGTIGYFCLRCHAPVATTMGLRRDQPIWDGPRVFREGVTCVACHRVKIPYTKANGERRMEPGDIYEPVYGASPGTGADIANKYSQFFKIKTDRYDRSPGQPIHQRAIQFEEIAESTFCASCHQVAVKPGIKLEVVWDQYRASPAYRDGVTCQDCHTGKVPGVDAGYSIGPAAVVDNKVVNPERKHSNHSFYGPGYSIAHPGIFPDNIDADRWKFNEWLEFDWRAGWGTDEFEDALADGKFQTSFPAVWGNADDRYDARAVVTANQKKLVYKKDLRRQLLENGSQLDGPFFGNSPALNQNLDFRFCLTNTNPGHNMPSGSLGAQPQVWMNVVLIGPAGNRIWESGYVDSHGDCADRHSLDVLAGKIPLDSQLMNLQTRFLTTNVKGTDREMYLPINFDFDQLPFLRPAQQPVTVINHPPFIRMESHSIPPLGSRNVKYSVPGRLMLQPGTYRLSVRVRSRAEPIYFMRFCGSTPEMIRSMNEWIADFHTSTVTFDVQ